ncbi:hypothetical protein PZB74_20130 [Porifericola rhodea]|uniref:hypothetical protein n=1 Tax=Porifericola rhodea TaxID=930972 RepID=UPI00266605E8|nr:hypothetical protein [Porifericola rhodea]WKN31263.1 hypothetical protein PZB74_20130 [Porifericola rhodea]
MNDLEKIFSEKLHNYKTPPPAEGWEQLSAALDAEEKGRKKIYLWRVAAAILLLFIVGVSWQSSQSTLDNSTLSEELEPDTSSKSPAYETVPEQLALSDKKESIPAIAEVETQKVAKDKRNSVEPKDHVKELNSAPKLVAQAPQDELVTQTSSTPVESPNKIMEEQLKSFEIMEVEPLELNETDLLAVDVPTTKFSEPVTIIYKPGAEQLYEEDKANALDFLSELKNSNISFSEIRNAKSELLAKVFNKKENEVTR